MSSSFVSESYVDQVDGRDPTKSSRKRRWLIVGNNSSHPNSPVTIMLHDEEHPGTSDSTREQMTIPFGVLAEIVGRQVIRSKIAELESVPPRFALDLTDQGGYAVRD